MSQPVARSREAGIMGDFVLVPREPTEEMLAAVSGFTVNFLVAEDEHEERPISDDDCAEVYRAMVAAVTPSRGPRLLPPAGEAQAWLDEAFPGGTYTAGAMKTAYAAGWQSATGVRVEVEAACDKLGPLTRSAAAPEPAEPSVPAGGVTDAISAMIRRLTGAGDLIGYGGEHLSAAIMQLLAPILAELAQARAENEELTAKWKDALTATNHNHAMFATEFQKRQAAEADARALREGMASLFERIHQDSEVAWVHDNIRAILSTPPSAPSEDALDARRYRWLRDNANPGFTQSGRPWAVMYSSASVSTWPQLEACLDAAIAASAEGEKT
jgi:hypothetical protein